jgi:hypothetical protein
MFTVATVDIVYITSITNTTIIVEGLVAPDGGTPIIKSGVCWSTSENPTIADRRTSDPLTSMNDGVPSNFLKVH